MASATYAHGIEARLRDGSSERLVTDVPAADLDQFEDHYRRLYPLAAALAQALGVECRFVESSDE